LPRDIREIRSALVHTVPPAKVTCSTADLDISREDAIAQLNPVEASRVGNRVEAVPEFEPVNLVAAGVDHRVVATPAGVVVVADSASQEIGSGIADQSIREAVPIAGDGCTSTQLEVLKVCTKHKAH
jgi:hypothetical protein